MRLTRKQCEEMLNEIGCRDNDLKENGGRVSRKEKYGTWLRRNDPIAFEIYLQERRREYLRRT